MPPWQFSLLAKKGDVGGEEGRCSYGNVLILGGCEHIGLNGAAQMYMLRDVPFGNHGYHRRIQLSDHDLRGCCVMTGDWHDCGREGLMMDTGSWNGSKKPFWVAMSLEG